MSAYERRGTRTRGGVPFVYRTLAQPRVDWRSPNKRPTSKSIALTAAGIHPVHFRLPDLPSSTPALQMATSWMPDSPPATISKEEELEGLLKEPSSPILRSPRRLWSAWSGHRVLGVRLQVLVILAVVALVGSQFVSTLR